VLPDPTVGAGLAPALRSHSLKPYLMLDAWRGFASIWVVLVHASLIIGVLFPDLAHSPVFVLCSRGGLGVQMFFVISGYCIASAAGSAVRHNHGFLGFMRARVKRIYPAYWLAFLLYALLAITSSWLVASGHLKSSILGDHDPARQPWPYTVSNLLLVQAPFGQSYLVGVSWTLCYEVFFYALVGLGLLCWKCKGEPNILSSLHALTAASLLLLVFAPERRAFPLDMWPQFGLGILLYDCLKHPGQLRPRAWAAGIALLVLVFVGRWDIPIGTLGEPGRLTYSVALAFAAALFWLHRFDTLLAKNAVIKVFSTIGLFSYSLYLMHVLCLGLLNQVAKRAHLPHSLAYAWLLLSLLLAIAAGRLFYHFCERPFLKGNRAAILEPARDAPPPVPAASVTVK